MSNYALSFKNPIADLASQEVDRVSIPLREMNSSGKNLYFSLQLVKFQLSLRDASMFLLVFIKATLVLNYSNVFLMGRACRPDIKRIYFTRCFIFSPCEQRERLFYCCRHALNRNPP